MPLGMVNSLSIASLIFAFNISSVLGVTSTSPPAPFTTTPSSATFPSAASPFGVTSSVTFSSVVPTLGGTS